MTATLRVAVEGCSDLLGQALLETLAERAFPIAEFVALTDSGDSADSVLFDNHSYLPQALESFDFAGVQLVFFCHSEAAAQHYAPRAVAAGCRVIDLTAQHRMDPQVPLCCGDSFDTLAAGDSRLLACAGSVSRVLARLLRPVQRQFGLQRVAVQVLSPVSARGREGVEALAGQTARLMNGQPVDDSVFGAQQAFNVIPQQGDLLADSGYTREELAVIAELRRLLALPDLLVNPHIVAVPVFYGESLLLQLDTQQPVSVAEFEQLLRDIDGVQLASDSEQGGNYKTAVDEFADHELISAGCVRQLIGAKTGINLWIVSDNVRKGVVLDAIAAAEFLLKSYF